MPLTYATPATIEPAKTGSTIHCVGVNIRLPRKGEATVTYYFEVLDDTGNLVESVPIKVALSQVQAEQPSAFQSVYGIIKKDAYERWAAQYGQGTVS